MTTTTTATATWPNHVVAASEKEDERLQDLELPSGPVETNLSFFTYPPTGQQAFKHNGDWQGRYPDGLPEMNFTLAKPKVMINDFRDYENNFRLAKNGIRIASGIQTRLTGADYNQTGFDNILLRESTQLLDDFLKAEGIPGKTIHAYDWTFRGPNSHRHPEFNVHVDHNDSTMRQSVDRWLADKAESFEGKRIRIYNIWQPLGRALYSNPLALCDPLSVKTKDLVDVEIRYPTVTWSSVGMAHTEEQTWYHVSGMRPDERLVFLSYDNSESGEYTLRVPHTSFHDPRTQPGAPPRVSVETRLLVVD
ncbi:Manganese-transporting ATPase 1 [Venturia nashicola]|uniref:Manganese-transporting ATPase 1 n=1 Tax=Venturia nashicola TaxID=86259 RepID=A0A4Z1PC12_9PEZI|nr:Manganese-transporting ATPase 1 [Venturia nashicola]TLD31889.1 Manganese-transporting ATPase 1 [Venturia nashicola]